MHTRLAVPAAVLLAGLAWSAPTPAQGAAPKIEGRVVDVQGRPLSGARVSIATASVRRGVSPY